MDRQFGIMRKDAVHMRNLYDIDPPEFEILEREDTDEGGLHYILLPVGIVSTCPCCGSCDIVKNGYRPRKVRDLNEHGKYVGLTIRQRKFICKDCGYPWTESFQSVGDSDKITVRMKEFVRQESLRKPFLQVGEELALSHSTVRRIFSEYAEELTKDYEIHAPRVLGIDENHLLNRYRAVFTDIENRLVIEMLPNRNKASVKKFLQSLPDRDRIKLVTIDMWNQYREVVNDVLPDVPIVVDKFHVIKEVNHALDEIRKHV